MVDLSKVAIRGSTQDHLEIYDITNDLVILKDGSAVMILEVKAVNFALLSEREQEAIIFAYAGFLNSLSFSIQIVIRSKLKDVSHYVDLLKEHEAKQENPLLKEQITKYREFITKIVKDNNVLDKKFYVAIPLRALEIGAASSAIGLFSKNKKGLPLPKETIIEKAIVALYPRRDHLLRQMGRMGLKSKMMNNQELIDLFYDIYNPSIDKEDKLKTVGFDSLEQ